MLYCTPNPTEGWLVTEQAGVEPLFPAAFKMTARPACRDLRSQLRDPALRTQRADEQPFQPGPRQLPWGCSSETLCAAWVVGPFGSQLRISAMSPDFVQGIWVLWHWLCALEVFWWICIL